MISKLYNLNKTKLEQNVMLKQKIKNQVNILENELDSINNTLNTTGVEKFGAIGDFKLLAIHKSTLKYEKEKLISNKNKLNQEIQKYDIIIISYQKEMEKYDYLLKEEKKEQLKLLEKYDEEIASEYMQAKFIKNLNISKENIV